jgi:hypothetical protein
VTTTTLTPTDAAFNSGVSRLGEYLIGIAKWAMGPSVACAVTDGDLRTRPAA